MMFSEVDFIVINDTRRPRTGGDYVYSVMKKELIRQGCKVNELSLPSMISFMQHSENPVWLGRSKLSFFEVLAYVQCYLSSLRKYKRGSRLVITSSCPTFPVLGHVTYHQPKAGIFARSIEESDSLRRLIGYRVEEDERLSPLWFFAKKLMRLHLSNSKFTRDLVKKMYNVDSSVLYPPVQVRKYGSPNCCNEKKRYVLFTRPEATTGISTLSTVARKLPSDIKLVIIGNIDRAGLTTLQNLKATGKNVEYLGFVDEARKVEVFRKSSIYVNLAINETFGISVVEALASGCVPLAHDSGAIPEYLPKEFRYSGPEEIAEKVAAYIDSKKEIRENLRGIAQRFDESYFRKRFMSLLKDLETSYGVSCFKG